MQNPPKSIVMMNVCDNSLIQGTIAPTADKAGGLSAKTAMHLKDNQADPPPGSGWTIQLSMV